MDQNRCRVPDAVEAVRHSELSPQVVDDEASATEASMITQLKHYEVQVLLKANHTQRDTARRAKVSLRTVRRIAEEAEVEHVDDTLEAGRRGIGRPSTTEPVRPQARERSARLQSRLGGPPRRARSAFRQRSTSSAFVSSPSDLTMSRIGTRGSFDQKMPQSSASEYR